MTSSTMQHGSGERATEARSGSADPFEGLTAQDCCFNCSMDACVITGEPICSHPRKGGLQSRQKADGAMVRRYNEARKFLAIAEAKATQFEGTM